MEDFFINSQEALAVLKKDIKSNTIRNGYIFEGESGIGKKTAAKLFTKMILCTGENKPCGVCNSCRMLEASSHPSVHYIVPSDGRKSIGADDIRNNLLEELYIRPVVSDRTIFIIDDADDMLAPAQNVLLKAFEEPPSYAIIILIALSAKNLLPTIVSRGTKVLFKPLPLEDMEGFVRQKYNADDNTAHFAATYSGGVIGKAIRIMENDKLLALRRAIIEASCTLINDKTSIYDVLAVFAPNGRRPDDEDFLFDVFISFFRDVFTLKVGGSLINSDYESEITSFASSVRAAAARNIVMIVADTQSNLNKSMKYDLWITNMLTSCWEEIHGTSNRGKI